MLTGMGNDGVKELEKLKKLGHKTIAQDQKSSAVYGMPKAALNTGAVEKTTPLEDINTEIFQYINSSDKHNK